MVQELSHAFFSRAKVYSVLSGWLAGIVRIERIYTLRKWAIWQSVTIFVLLNATFFVGLREYLIKPACVMPVSQKTLTYMDLAHLPEAEPFFLLVFAMMWINLLVMFFDLSFGHRAFDELVKWLRSLPGILTAGTVILIMALSFQSGFYAHSHGNLSGMLFATWIAYTGVVLHGSTTLYRRLKNHSLAK